MRDGQARSKYTHEFKREAVRQIKSGQTLSAISKILNVPKSSLSGWMRQDSRGELGTISEKSSVVPVTPDQMELARLRAEVGGLRMERGIVKKAAAYFA